MRVSKRVCVICIPPYVRGSGSPVALRGPGGHGRGPRVIAIEDAGLYRDALGRAYFGLFHAARALLMREGYNTRGPNAVVALPTTDERPNLGAASASPSSGSQRCRR